MLPAGRPIDRMTGKLIVTAGLLALVGCGDRPPLEPVPPNPLDACVPIFGFPKAETTAYYLTKVDGAPLPKTISLPDGLFTVRASLIELHDRGTQYLWAFYSGSGPVGGTSAILGQFAIPREDGRIDLLVGNDPTQVRGIAAVEPNRASARITTEDRAALGANNMGTHEFLFMRCP